MNCFLKWSYGFLVLSLLFPNVDAADYVYWRKNDFGDLLAYATWRQHFGESSLSGSGGDVDGVVPEPGSIAVVAVGMLGAWLRRRS